MEKQVYERIGELRWRTTVDVRYFITYMRVAKTLRERYPKLKFSDTTKNYLYDSVGYIIEFTFETEADEAEFMLREGTSQ